MIFRLLYKGRCYLRRSRDILQKGQTDKKKEELKEQQNIIDLSKIDITNPKSIKQTIDKLKQNLQKPSEPKPQEKSHVGQAKSNKFPFKYGGVSKYDPNDDFILLASKGRVKTFENMYGSLLDAAEKKNKSWLQTNTITQLVEPLLVPNSLYQLHRSSPIRVLFNNLSLIIGAQVKQNCPLKKVANDNNIGLYMKQTSLSNISNEGISLGLPVMISYKLTFLSTRRLSLKQDSKQVQQAHVVRISQDIKLDVFKMMSLMKTLNKQTVSEEVRTLLLDSNNPWVITNVDSFLHENYN